MLVIFELLELFELFITVLQMFSNDEAPCRSTLRIPFITISTKSTLNKNHNISSPPFVLDSLIKNLQRSWLCAIIKSRDRVLRLNHLSFRLYSLAALGCSRSGFFYAWNRNSQTLQRYRNLHSYRLPSPNPYGPFEFWLSRSTLFSWLFYSTINPSREQAFYSSFQKNFPAYSTPSALNTASCGLL